MGVVTSHVSVAVPSPLTSRETWRPFAMARSASGAVRRTIMPSSGSSLGWSFVGHHRSAPSPWQLTATHGSPPEASDHVKPPSHGGRGATRGVPP